MSLLELVVRDTVLRSIQSDEGNELYCVYSSKICNLQGF